VRYDAYDKQRDERFPEYETERAGDNERNDHRRGDIHNRNIE
jgi:hypothetical protein